jgi:hypothetical protein
LIVQPPGAAGEPLPETDGDEEVIAHGGRFPAFTREEGVVPTRPSS